MISYTESEIEELLQSKPFWGYMKPYVRENSSIQTLTFRMLKREKKSWHTLRRYFEGIKTFVEYQKVETPDQALQKVKDSQDAAEIVDDYINYLVNKGLSPINIKAHFFGVKKWLISNRCRISWEFVAKPKAGSRIRDRIPSKEELRRILGNANLRDKAMFMTAASSGLRGGTLVRLKVKDLKPIEDLAIIEVEGGEGKKLAEGKSYFTFITPETYRIIQDYLATRQTTPESPLFSHVSSEASFDRYITNLSRQWRKLIQKAKLDVKVRDHTWTELHLHVLRKFFQTTCKINGVKADYYNFWLGHISSSKEQYLDDSYFRAPVKEHLTQYRKVLPGLTVFGASTQQFQTLEKEIQTLREQLNQKDQEIEPLKERMTQLEKHLELIVSGPGVLVEGGNVYFKTKKRVDEPTRKKARVKSKNSQVSNMHACNSISR